MGKLDPITFEVISNGSHSIACDMGVTIWRTAYSTVVRDSRDCSAAIFDRRGRLVAQADMIPALLGSMHLALKETLADHIRPERICEGDVLLSNHPYIGGTHTPDIMVFTPVFSDGQLVAFAGSIAHHIDLGSVQAGGIGVMSDMFQEGLLIPPVKLYERGELNETLLKILRTNSRWPDLVEGDLRAQVTANKLGVRRIEDMIRRYGASTLDEAWSRQMDHSESRIRAELGRLPQGEYRIEGYLDSDGLDLDVPLKIVITVKLGNGSVTYDFTGSAAQCRGNVNCVKSAVAATCYYVTRCISDPEVLENEGCYRPVEMILPEGSIVNPTPPAATSGKHPMAQRMADLLIQAFAQIAPDRAAAASCGSTCNYTIVYRGDGIQYEMMGGGFGARKMHDGIDAIQVNMSKCVGLQIEEAEAAFPVRIERFELVRDSGGAGRQRGGLGLRRDVRVQSPAVLSISSDTELVPPPGTHGGEAGFAGRKVINLGTNREKRVNGKAANVALDSGDVISFITPGSGGFGPAVERDPQLVLLDVLDGKVSATAAREQYCVVLDGAAGTPKVDAAATAALRRAKTPSIGRA
jgi:N-methylhydantoinase B